MNTKELQPEVMTGESLDISEQRRKELKQLFPGVFTETVNDKGEVVETIDFERLKAELGTFSDIYEGRRERYGMEWPGKRDCMKLIQEPSRATLKPCREESVDFDTTQNLFIEGDNLEVLKLLQKSYYGKVKMIYIDPPYNTGNEFIYPDKYSESLETYLAYAGLVDDEGKRFATNTATEGRFHTKWLNMMYPRLYLARNLLQEDGVIFISIDDNEAENLRRLCNEIFGEENFLAQIAWEKRYTRSNNAKRFYSLKDNILAYRKSDSLEFIKEKRTEKSDSNYSNSDDDPRGPWMTSSYVNPATKAERPNLIYEIKNPFTGRIISHPTHAWKYSREENSRHLEEKRLWWATCVTIDVRSL
ncbi:site-specific DNA-methyltransferase [Thiohalomonas denitrificans]|uniref:site-specific DNA-methyltransferase n=1 Tax=Thiohalomonas denitrificans TaxID=415747 RepID=UPI0026ECAE19|nr:site-specific DNA-methyltransferase [Thiohalomonas denitrificans]